MSIYRYDYTSQYMILAIYLWQLGKQTRINNPIVINGTFLFNEFFQKTILRLRNPRILLLYKENALCYAYLWVVSGIVVFAIHRKLVNCWF